MSNICICSLFRNVFRAISTNHQTNFGKMKRELSARRKKKWQVTYIAPLQPPTLATFLSWGSSAGAGRIRLAVAKVTEGGIICKLNCGKYLPGVGFRQVAVFMNAYCCYVSAGQSLEKYFHCRCVNPMFREGLEKRLLFLLFRRLLENILFILYKPCLVLRPLFHGNI